MYINHGSCTITCPHVGAVLRNTDDSVETVELYSHSIAGNGTDGDSKVAVTDGSLTQGVGGRASGRQCCSCCRGHIFCWTSS